jgi:hypothetical protein
LWTFKPTIPKWIYWAICSAKPEEIMIPYDSGENFKVIKANGRKKIITLEAKDQVFFPHCSAFWHPQYKLQLIN